VRPFARSSSTRACIFVRNVSSPISPPRPVKRGLSHY
jgi:hypothetical protein